MSRLFDALQAARPDITDRFDSAGEDTEQPARSGQGVAEGRFRDQFSRLLERLDTRSGHSGARVIGFAGLHGGEGTSTVVREFAYFLATDLQATALVLDLEADRGGRAMPRLEGPEEVSGAQPEQPFASASMVIPERARPTASELDELIAPLIDRYQWILIDSPALLTGGGCLAALAAAQNVILVAEAERSHARDLQRATQAAGAAGANVAGMVLNKRANRIPRWFRNLLERLHLS